MTPEDIRLVLITDWSLGPSLLPAVERALQAGPGIAVQHRHPGAEVRLVHDEAVALQAVTSRHGAPLFINGHLDVALALGTHVHCPGDGLDPAEVRKVLPPARWLSLPVHALNDVPDGAMADLALVSPVFTPGSKPDDARPTLGPDGFLALAKVLSCTAVALGGISPTTARELPGERYACLTAVLRAEDPLQAARELLAVSRGR